MVVREREVATPPTGKISFKEFLEWATEDTWAEFHRLGVDGRYHPALPDAGGAYHLQTISDFWLRLDWLWQDPLPQAEAIARQIGGAAHICALAQIIVQTLGPEELRHLLDEMGSLTRTS